MKKKTEFEIFSEDTNYHIQQLNRKPFTEPSCFNSIIRVNKYKVTFELIEEPDEVIIQRMKDLLKSSKNMHHRSDLIQYAKRRFGIHLMDENKE